MVFQYEAQFQQFIHCKFRENIVRVLYIPTIHKKHAFLIVNKYGKVGLYDADRFTLFHTYLLDLSMPLPLDAERRRMPRMMKRSIDFPQPKCQRTHLVVDALLAPDLHSVFYLTTKGILQGYDIGEIEVQKYGVELLPMTSLGKLTRVPPTEMRNLGHVETHRISGLSRFPTCMEYNAAGHFQIDAAAADQSPAILLIGDSDGCVTIITIPKAKNPFGCRKVRGILHHIEIQDLEALGRVSSYKAHGEPITELRFLSQRQLIVSSSRDKKASVYVKDLTDILKPTIISTSKGVSTFAYSESLKMIATGGDDLIIRLFNQFVPTVTQMELQGHRAPLISLQFLQVPFSCEPILLSLSTDVELRAWDPSTYVCLQSIYIAFPIKSNIFCKTPEFGRRAIFVHQPSFLSEFKNHEATSRANGECKFGSKKKQLQRSRSLGMKEEKGQHGFLVILYCNSYAKLWIEKQPSQHWPFDFEELATEFDTLSSKYEQKLKWRQASTSQNPKQRISISSEELDEVESKLECYVAEVMANRRRVDQELGRVKPKGTTLSSHVIQYCHTLKNDTEKRRLLQEGGAFKVMPMFDLEPLHFTPLPSNERGILPVTNMMQAAGLVEVRSPDDLVSPLAIECFSAENMHQMRMDTTVGKLSHFQLGRQASSAVPDEGSKVNVIMNPCDEEKSYIRIQSISNQNNNFAACHPASEELCDSYSDSDLLNDDDYLIKSLEKLMDLTPEPQDD